MTVDRRPARPLTWSRVVMNRACPAWVSALPHAGSDALEIADDRVLCDAEEHDLTPEADSPYPVRALVRRAP